MSFTASTVSLATILLFMIISSCSGGKSGESGEQQDDDATNPELVDPAPQYNAPGEYGCDGCPSGQINDFQTTTTASSESFEGFVNDAIGNGKYYLGSPTGSVIAGSIPTDPQGNFNFEVPLFCGAQITKFVWFNNTGNFVFVGEIFREDCENADIQLTLNWDDIGLDFDLHLIRPGGQLNDAASDCTWSTCDENGSLDWGVNGDVSDNPIKDVDNTQYFGPENIYLNNPENGLYNVLVEHWGSGGPDADGSVVINANGQLNYATVENLPSHFVWKVGTIEWPSGNVILDGTKVDCTSDWFNGCSLPLTD